MEQQQLFNMSDEEDKNIGIGDGYSIEWRTAKLVAVYRYGVPYRHVEINAGIDKRRLAVELIMEGQITKSKLAKALRVSRQSIDNWEKTFFKSGFEGLVNSYKGSVDKGRADKADKLPTGNKARQLEYERRQKRQFLQEQQLRISFEPSEKATQQEQEGTVDSGAEAEPKLIDFKDIEQAPAYQEAQLPELFEETYDFKENRYAGSFIYWGIFQNAFNVMGLCQRIIGHYSVVIYLFAMMMVNGFGSIEKLKTVYKREFGNLAGIRQLLSKPNIWKLVHNLCRLGRSGELIEKFFHEQAKKSLVALYWLYIDGHFVPYYGKNTVHSGFYMQRGQAMPGQTEMFVHDCQGQIVYFEIQEGKGDLKTMMRQMS
ncbi:MAG: helix-turn-helix domain-containing protein, partial [Pseudomonadota bacterium]|nr:helix-turn-helix domain-containing protein [Pseudomonadota bacterium]